MVLIKIWGNETMKKNIFVFDCESDGLFGRTFAVGAVVADRDGNILDKFEMKSTGAEKEVKSWWVKENVIPHIATMPKCRSIYTLYDEFYKFYLRNKNTCEIYSDCNFPVETNFLSDVAKQDINNREFNMPFPLLDIATPENISIDRVEHFEKKNADYICQSPATRKLRKHNPLDDAVASLCLLLNKKVRYDIK